MPRPTHPYLRSSVRGAFYYLYLIVDIYSRKVMGWWVAAEESMDIAADLIERATRVRIPLNMNTLSGET